MRRKMSRHPDRGLGLRQRLDIGRPSKLTLEVRERFLASIRAGCHRETAAKSAGIGVATMYRWFSDDRGPYRDFFEEVERTEAEAEQSAVASVTSRIPEDPKLALAFLARRHPTRWAARGEAATRMPIEPGATPQPPATSRPLDPRVRVDYERLAPMDRYRRTMIAMARCDEDQQLLLRETCPPGDVPEVNLLLKCGELVVWRVLSVWLVARRMWDRAVLGSGAMLLGDGMYNVGLADGSKEDARHSRAPDAAFERSGPIGQAFLGMGRGGVATAEEHMLSVRAGILRFVEWLGFGEVQSFSGGVTLLAEELAEFEPRSSSQVDDRVAAQVDDELRAIWGREVGL